jgi:hypothetical protein
VNQLGELSQVPMIFDLVQGPLAQVLVPAFFISFMLDQNDFFVLNLGRFKLGIVILDQSLIWVEFLYWPTVVYQIQLFLRNNFHGCSWLLRAVPQGGKGKL